MMFPEARILEIDLTTKKIDTIIMPGSIHQLYPGGSALGMYYLLKGMKPGIDPLSPENLIIFSVSPLAGYPVSGLSRMTVTTKSPLTGTAGDAQVGGSIAVNFKANGYDALIIKGKSETPVYIYIDGEDVKICDAQDLWGKFTGETEDSLKAELADKRLDVAAIGPAGENLVMFASIMHKKSRAFGRNGTGAVMGSKNLKAIAIKPKKMPAPFDPEGFKKFVSTAKQDIQANESCVDMRANGTNGGLGSKARAGFLATRNWQTGWFEEWNQIDGPAMAEKIKIGDETCFGCGVQCKQVVEVKGKVDPQYGGPEYESVATLGSYCGISDIEEIAYANMLCNMYGMDTISCGGTISFAMECYEKGLLTKDDTDGRELKFGNSEIFKDIFSDIAYRKGKLGNLLADGSYRAGEKIGNGAIEFSISCKKQELPAHMPQHKPSLGIIYSVNPFGADHESSEHDTCMGYALDSKERGWLAQVGGNFTLENAEPGVLKSNNIIFAYNTQKYYSLLDSLSVCQFVWGPSWQLYGPEQLVQICNYTIGWDTSVYELMEIGERRLNMMRQFNAREGFTKEDDTLPSRIFIPLSEGPSKGVCFDEKKFQEGKEFYYQLAGWNAADGNPSAATLMKLSLDWLI